MKVGLLPREPLHRNPTRISRAFQQRLRSPEPECPHRITKCVFTQARSNSDINSCVRSMPRDETPVGLIAQQGLIDLGMRSSRKKSSCARNPAALPASLFSGTITSAANCHATATYAKPGFMIAAVFWPRGVGKSGIGYMALEAASSTEQLACLILK